MPHPRRTAAPMQGPGGVGQQNAASSPPARSLPNCRAAGRAGSMLWPWMLRQGTRCTPSSGGGGAVLWANQPSRYCRAACGRRCRTAGYCTSTTALPLSGSCRAKPVSWKACTGSCTPATSSVAGTLGAPLRPKQYSRARSTAYTPAQLASSRPGDRGRLTLRLRLCTPGSTTAPHKSRLSSAYHAHNRAKRPRPGRP